MSRRTSERAFEEAIVASLVDEGGYVARDSRTFDAELGFDREMVLHFLQSTQPKAWQRLVSIHRKKVEEKVLRRLFDELDSRGMLDLLRHGMIDYGVRLRLAYFKPAHGLNPETLARYKKNILSVTRQVRYSTRNKNSIDLLLSLNGLPVATAELKNQFTGQRALDARRQYAQDRDPKALLFQFKKRALVHFALDTDEVWMTTRLNGKKTRYLPFNRGHHNGAGNPPNQNGHRTAYLWQEIWARESWLAIIGRFIHLEKKGKGKGKETLIFPRYHQLDVVRQLRQDARQEGAGHNYLIQHSAGSGKSNSIAWLAYQLSSLHNAADERIFDSVVVITDRRVLDSQLQETIYQFEHKTGVVEKIDKHSSQLAEALTRGSSIIITTLQKFPFVLDEIGDLPKRQYAIIVDEAHSSQGGESAKKMKEALSFKDSERYRVRESEVTYEVGEKKDAENNISLSEGVIYKADKEENAEDSIRQSMEARGRLPNLSFFAFTATPKAKTLELFGTPNEEGIPAPFHLYSMRQAIEEGFILDVLQHYTTYKSYFKLYKAIADDPKLNKKKAARAIARFVALHPHNIAQKAEVIIEHFRQCVMHKLGGKAKAMVITSSRPHLVRYKQAFDEYLQQKGYHDLKALVAFTPFTDKESGIQYSEQAFNGFSEKELPAQFASDAYQLLLVADKYQTGFDQPLLHTMYIDKKLSGVRAVQTLSRLNRIYPGKEDTFVIDFANEAQEILDAFQPYYEQTTLSATTDPNKLYDLKAKLDHYRIIWRDDVETFARLFFKPQKRGGNASFRGNKREHGLLNAAIDAAVERFCALEEDEPQEEFKHTLTTFVRLYAFLAQIMPFSDAELEKFYAYSRHLLRKLPKRSQSDAFKLQDEIALEYYRLQKIKEGALELEKEAHAPLSPLTEAGSRQEKEEQAKFSEIIDLLNQRFGTHFTDADKYFFRQLEEALLADEPLTQQAQHNSIDNFKHGFEDAFLDKLIERMDANQELFARIMDNEAFGTFVRDWIRQRVYASMNEGG